MKIIKVFVGMLVLLTVGVIIFFVLSNDKTLLTHPKGIIAHSELDLIIKNYLLMLIVIVPTFILLFAVA